MTTTEILWMTVGFGGQALFASRFLLQWISSERAKKSVVPVGFWFFSIAGGLILFSYALHKHDPVFIAGQGAGIFIYSRNLYFIFRERHVASSAREHPLT